MLMCSNFANTPNYYRLKILDFHSPWKIHNCIYFPHFSICTGADYIDGGKTPRGAPCRATNSLLLPYNIYQNGYNPMDRWSKRYPTAHQVSRNLFQITTDNVRNMRGFSTMFMTFGQFLDHDVALVPHESCKKKEYVFISLGIS